MGAYPKLNVLKNHDLVTLSWKKINFLRNLTERYISENRIKKSIKKSRISMSQNHMKWLATLLMLLDLIGFLLEAEPMRIIGRLSFPLFAWIFAQNWKKR